MEEDLGEGEKDTKEIHYGLIYCVAIFLYNSVDGVMHVIHKIWEDAIYRAHNLNAIG